MPMARMASSDLLMIVGVEMVVLEDVTGHHDELRAGLLGERAHTGYGVAAGR